MIRLAVALLACSTMVSCGVFGIGNRARQAETENRLPFRATLSTGEEEQSFTVAVEAAGADIDELRESVRFEATKHCLFNFGASDTVWDRDTDGEWAYTQTDGAAVFSGRCAPR